VLPGKSYGPDELLDILRRRWWMLVVPAVIGLVAAAIVTWRLPDRFKSETLVMVVPQRVPETYVRSPVTTRIEDRLRTINQQIHSRSRLERIIKEFNLYPELRQIGMENAVEAMSNNIQTDVLRGDAFRVTFVADDPVIAQKVAERLAGLFSEENMRDREVLAESTNQFLETELNTARQRLVETENRLEDYRRRFSGELPEQETANLQGLHNAQMQLGTITEAINRDRERRLFLERQLAEATTPVPSATETTAVRPGDPAPAPGSPAALLSTAQEQLREARVRLKPGHPDLSRLERTVRELEENVNRERAAAQAQITADGATARVPATDPRAARVSEMRSELALLDQRLGQKQIDEKTVRGVIGEYQRRLEAAPTRQTQLVALTRDYETIRRQYTSLLENYEESKVAANLERRQIGETFRILDPARVPEKPFEPKRLLLNAAGFGAGFFLGLCIVGFLEFRDKSLRSEADVLNYIELPVLASVPGVVTTAQLRRRRFIRLTVSYGTTAVVFIGILTAWLLGVIPPIRH
jgi:polysaccharide chain length determinant protein (PEP-CTERM system associated)